MATLIFVEKNKKFQRQTAINLRKRKTIYKYAFIGSSILNIALIIALILK